MDKEEILRKSRIENKNYDEREVDIRLRAHRFSNIVIILFYLFSVIIARYKGYNLNIIGFLFVSSFLGSSGFIIFNKKNIGEKVFRVQLFVFIVGIILMLYHLFMIFFWGCLWMIN